MGAVASPDGVPVLDDRIDLARRGRRLRRLGAVGTGASELVDLLGIVIEIPPHLSERVSSKFLQKSIRQQSATIASPATAAGTTHQSDRSYAAFTGSLVTMSVVCSGCAKSKWFQVPSHDTSSPLVMPPSSPPARFVARRNVAPIFRRKSHPALRFRKSPPRHSSADLHCLHRLHAHQRLRQPPIQLLVPLRMAAKSHGTL